MLNNKSLYLLGYASGIAGVGLGSGKGPIAIQNSGYLSRLLDAGIRLNWEKMFQSQPSQKSILSQVADLCGQLAQSTAKLVRDDKSFIVLGGDHTSGIGTWSGVSYAKRNQGDLGLIWIDAHMDSHTPETTPSGHIHGMPVACLLGYGDKSLTGLCDDLPKIKPENTCLIGIRSYESGEADLLKKLQVKVFYMEEVKQRGMSAVLEEAVKIVTRDTVGYGISIDIDSMDPNDAPGTGSIEPDGILGNELCSALGALSNDPRLLGVEIAEFDPDRDRDQITEKLVLKLISSVTLGKSLEF